MTKTRSLRDSDLAASSGMTPMSAWSVQVLDSSWVQYNSFFRRQLSSYFFSVVRLSVRVASPVAPAMVAPELPEPV